MFSEVCISLTTRCFTHHCCTSEGLVSYEITPTMFVVWPPPCTKENKAHGGSARSLIVKTAGSGPGEACRKAHRRPTCAWERPEAICGVTRPRAWPLRGAPTRTRRNLRASRYLDKKYQSHRREFASLPHLLPSAFILLPWLCALLF